MATRWGLESPLVAETSPRRFRDVSWRLVGSPGSRGKFKLISLGSRGDVSLVRAQAIVLVSRVARVAATDQSRQSRRRLRQ